MLKRTLKALLMLTAIATLATACGDGSFFEMDFSGWSGMGNAVHDPDTGEIIGVQDDEGRIYLQDEDGNLYLFGQVEGQPSDVVAEDGPALDAVHDNN